MLLVCCFKKLLFLFSVAQFIFLSSFLIFFLFFFCSLSLLFFPFFSLSFLGVGCDDLDICSCHDISLSSVAKRRRKKGSALVGGGGGGGGKTCHFNILDFIYSEFCCVAVLFPSQKYCSWKNHAGYPISVFILSINDFRSELLTEIKVSGELRSS